MYASGDKEKLYWLLDQYLQGKIDEATFCDEFYLAFDLEILNLRLSEKEFKIFNELSAVSSRFSEFEEDHKLDERAFTTVKELREKINITQQELNNLIS